MSAEKQSVLAVTVPEADHVLDIVRNNHRGQVPLPGVPPHITLLYPWMPPDLICPETLGELAEFFNAFHAFDFTLELGWFGHEVLLLVPQQPAPFIQITEAIVRRWPAYPYYGGDYSKIEPHVSLAYGEGSDLENLADLLKHMMPISSRFDRVGLSGGIPGEMSLLAAFDLPRVEEG